MTNFSIGDKVVCVDDKFPPDISKLYDALPVKDSTYVVRDIRLGINLTMEGDVSVLLIGLVNPKADSKANLERGFRADRFRPLEELRNEQTATKTVEEKKELVQSCIGFCTVKLLHESKPLLAMSEGLENRRNQILSKQ